MEIYLPRLIGDGGGDNGELSEGAVVVDELREGLEAPQCAPHALSIYVLYTFV